MFVAAAARIPAFVPHPDVWLLVAALLAGYAIAITRLGPRFVEPGRAPVTRLQVVCWILGVAAVWIVIFTVIYLVPQPGLAK